MSRLSSVAGDASASAISRAISGFVTVTHGRPIAVELPKKISPNDSPTTA